MEKKAAPKAVRLLKNTIYPTYQLYATMASKSTSPKDGLKIAALTVLEWVKERLGEDIPSELENIPSPDEYKSCDNKSLQSFHINQGYVIDVVSLPDKGMWSLQITEPHLGSEPGKSKQRVSAVPGRILETNMAFKISGSELECGFNLMVSDLEGTKEKSEVYRFAVIKRLATNKDFGLKQITVLDRELKIIETQKNVDDFVALTRNSNNQLPFVVFTQLFTKTEMPDIQAVLKNDDLLKTPPLRLSGLPEIDIPKAAQPPKDPDYDMKQFASSGLGYCRTYYLDSKMQDSFVKKTGIKINSGDIIVIDPCAFGSKVQHFKYEKSEAGRVKTIEKLTDYVHCFAREKNFSYGSISFLSAARSELIRSTERILEESVATSEKEKQGFAELTEKWKEELAKKEGEINTLKKKYGVLEEELFDVKNKQSRNEERLTNENNELREALAKKDELLEYYNRKKNYPKSLDKILDWANDSFEGRLYFHDKAYKTMKNADPNKFDAQQICDALVYLATDYWDYKFGTLSEEGLKRKCSEKYGRPYEITPLSDYTTENAPFDYKIKYFVGKDGKKHESVLDQHLKIGNKSDNLLRIYFLLDKGKKLFVIGSLPAHLTNIKKF